MHLNECFELAFSRPTADCALEEKVNANPATLANYHDYPESVPSSSTQSQQQSQQQQEIVQGSVVSAVQCIISEWGTKAQTNFYIPPEHHAGYSYLFEHEQSMSIHNSPHLYHTQQSHLYDHHHHTAFVYAKEINNLHPHHYEYTHDTMSNSTHVSKMTLTAMHSSMNSLTSLANGSTVHNELHHQLPLSIITSRNVNSNIQSQMTVPYMHPHLEMPVPPLHLPWYFGALCFSFALGGGVMLCLPPKWTKCGGGIRRSISNGDNCGEMREEHAMHWFPYRSFALILLLCQSPCSFLADYIHMTNISPWHTIDRFLACILMALELGKLIVMRPYTRPVVYLINLLCCGVAIFCFLNSQKSQQRLSEDDFVFWHCGWHCYPLMCVIVRLMEECLDGRWGEYYSFEQCEAKRGEGGGTLLSTIAMNQHVVEEKQPNSDQAMGDKKCGQTQTPVKKKVRESAASETTANGMPSPGLRRSRRIARQKPEAVQLST